MYESEMLDPITIHHHHENDDDEMMMDTIDLTREEEENKEEEEPGFFEKRNHVVLQVSARDGVSSHSSSLSSATIHQDITTLNYQKPMEQDAFSTSSSKPGVVQTSSSANLLKQEPHQLTHQKSTSSFKQSTKAHTTTLVQDDDLTIQCPLCYDWFGSHLIESHTATCPCGEVLPEDKLVMSAPPPLQTAAKEYFKDFADIVISDFSDGGVEDTIISHPCPSISPPPLTKSFPLSRSSSSIDDHLLVLTDRGDIRFHLLEPLSPIKFCVNLFDLQRQGTRTYQDGTMIFDYLGQFSSSDHHPKSRSKVLEKQQKSVGSSSSQKSSGKLATKPKWFTKKRFFTKRK